jgi:hypothetical protein
MTSYDTGRPTAHGRGRRASLLPVKGPSRGQRGVDERAQAGNTQLMKRAEGRCRRAPVRLERSAVRESQDSGWLSSCEHWF